MKSTKLPLKTGAADASAAETAQTDRTGKTSKKPGKSPRATPATSNPLGGAKAAAAEPGSGTSRGTSTPRSSGAKKAGTAKDEKKGGAETDRPKSSKEKAKPSATPLLPAAAESSAASSSKDAAPKTKMVTDGPNAKKIEFLSDELLARKPLDEKQRDALIKKAGPPKQEVHFERNENHRPIGRPDELTPSRHERIPPTCIVLMFNCFEASFDLIYGDITTMPESDTTELRSLTSGKSLGRIKITPEKGALAFDAAAAAPAAA